VLDRLPYVIDGYGHAGLHFVDALPHEKRLRQCGGVAERHQLVVSREDVVRLDGDG
jgi:hypothetical protein